MTRLPATVLQAPDHAHCSIVGDHWCAAIDRGAGEGVLEFAAKRLAVDFPQADAEAPSFADSRSDAELSIIGVM